MSKLDNMCIGSEVDLIFRTQGDEIIKKTTVIDRLDPKYGTGILCKLIYFEAGEIVTTKDLVEVIIHNIGSNNDYSFKQVRALPIVQNNCLALICDREATVISKRDATRVDCNNPCLIRIAGYPGSIKGTMKDISLSGLACVIKNTPVNLQEDADIFINVLGSEEDIKLLGNIVRLIDLDTDNEKLVGIKLKNIDNQLIKFIHSINKR